MLRVPHHQDDDFKQLPSVLAENSFTWSDSFSFDQQTFFSEQHIYSDPSCPSWTPHDNALGLFNMCGSESVSTTEQIPPLSTMITSNSFNTPFFHQPPTTFDSPVRHGRLSVPHDPFACQEPAIASVQEMSAPHLNHAVSQHESSHVRRPTLRSRRDRGSASQLLPGVSTPQSRYAPYLPDTQKRDTSTLTYYLCLWSDDGTHLCGAAVAGTRTSIWRHLHEVHATQLNADKTIQKCMWETCGRSMRRESIARHILTVHFHDKVECPSCRTYFARRDSLQRHQRLCASKEEATSQDACTVAPGV